ncbi:30S ribosomal protein S8 [Patescibacteria group bacterium]|nr:30S ribosomal protein S8 [Patescibacteria group bacterium]
MTDPIADMLTRIRNALLVKKQSIVLPYSNIKFNIGKILDAENLIEKIEVLDLQKDSKSKKTNKNSNFKQIKIFLKYGLGQKSVIKGLKRISKPGRKVYVSKDKIPVVLQGFGLAILSTSQGLMTDRQAREKKIGGEVICQIW